MTERQAMAALQDFDGTPYQWMGAFDHLVRQPPDDLTPAWEEFDRAVEHCAQLAVLRVPVELPLDLTDAGRQVIAENRDRFNAAVSVRVWEETRARL